MGNPPVTLPCISPHPSLFFLNSQAFKIRVAGPDLFPPFPGDHPDAASDPFIQPLHQAFGICQLEVIYPAAY